MLADISVGAPILSWLNGNVAHNMSGSHIDHDRLRERGSRSREPEGVSTAINCIGAIVAGFGAVACDGPSITWNGCRYYLCDCGFGRDSIESDTIQRPTLGLTIAVWKNLWSSQGTGGTEEQKKKTSYAA